VRTRETAILGTLLAWLDPELERGDRQVAALASAPQPRLGPHDTRDASSRNGSGLLRIGFAIAEGLAESGAAVVVNGRTQAAVDRAVAALKSVLPGAILRGVAADLGTAPDCAALVTAEPATGILVNNVGIFRPQDFFAIPDSGWTRFFEVNVMSGVRLSRAYLPGMLQRDLGRVIFVSPESVLNIPMDMIHYGVTKTANLAVSRRLAKRAAGTGVTVKCGPARPDAVRVSRRC
jgi:NAD(P)-dependent dehydrogenase (short-subunit alcohol dehydrogenase family)